MIFPNRPEAFCGVTIVVTYLAFLMSTAAHMVLWPALAAVLIGGSFSIAGGIAVIRHARHTIPEGTSFNTFSGRKKLFKYAYGGTAIAFSTVLVLTAVSYALVVQTAA